MSSSRSCYLVLWSLETLTGQQRFSWYEIGYVKRKVIITPQASYLRQAALLVLFKITKGLFLLCSHGFPIIFLTLTSVNIRQRIFATLALVNIV